jgi:methylated-DNA-protein-cysteine methyltransferase-like protein
MGKQLDTYFTIWMAVRNIPRGKVSTYGDIAHLSGFTGQARLVGYALHTLPPGTDVPWHRVISAGGNLSLRGEAAVHQRALLEREGVLFQGKRLDLSRYRWVTAGAGVPHHRRDRKNRRGHS